TITGNLHTKEDMHSIGKWISGAKKYFLQPFKDSGDIVAGSEYASSFECEKAHAEALLAVARQYVPDAQIRG
ncbi:MAG: anaerobic ribonucleoside-triphosphate reductase activating protein, partial [Clostridia bacterium]|nr:anaerobic ribonucleoside-triphosphate reductase activating protein [Clostridia bacterium]